MNFKFVVIAKLHCFSKTPLTLHTITSMHINQFRKFFAQILRSEYTIERQFVIPPLLIIVSLLPGEIGSFQSCSLLCLIWLAISSTLINFDIFFVKSKAQCTNKGIFRLAIFM